jgi:hypothetical protein
VVSYWYNGFICETNIGDGLNVFNYSGHETGRTPSLSRSNPPNPGVLDRLGSTHVVTIG